MLIGDQTYVCVVLEWAPVALLIEDIDEQVGDIWKAVCDIDVGLIQVELA